MMKKYNVLWIQTDEMRVDSLGCCGGDNDTPNIDGLAAQGALFRRHFTTSPICVPSRVSELTGCYPCRTGVLENSVHYNWGKWPRELVAFPEIFAENGWATANFGKYHTPSHGTWGENWHLEHLNDAAHHCGLVPPHDEAAHEVLHLGHDKRNIVVAGRYPEHPRVSPTRSVTDHALEWLEGYQHIRRPFFLRVSYLAPHSPVLAPEPYYSMYRDRDFAWDRPTPELLASLPDYEKHSGEYFGGVGYYHAHSEEEYQRMRRSYYALVRHIDDEVGRLIARLKATGEYENTIILFSSDHGDLMGEYGQFQKAVFYDLTANVPCILAGPGVKPGEYHHLTECVDVAPTLLALCGLEDRCGEQFAGGDMFVGGKDAVFGEILIDGCRRLWIRTQTHSLDITVEKDGAPVAPAQYDGKLIDLAADPLYHRNLYGDPAYAAVQQQLTARLLAHSEAQRVPVQCGRSPRE